MGAWRDAARVLAAARADLCLPCNGRPGACTCDRRDDADWRFRAGGPGRPRFWRKFKTIFRRARNR